MLASFLLLYFTCLFHCAGDDILSSLGALAGSSCCGLLAALSRRKAPAAASQNTVPLVLSVHAVSCLPRLASRWSPDASGIRVSSFI